MKNYSNPDIGIQFPLKNLEIFKETEGWLVLKHPDEDAFLSVQFTNHFFTSPEETEQYIQNEIQLVANANDLVQSNGVTHLEDDTVTATYFQYIDNISHLVFIGVKLLPGNNGYWYMAVTKDEVLTDFCESIFNGAITIDKIITGKKDSLTENKLAGHTLKYLSSYNSNWGSGGGTSTEKSFKLFEDRSFRYQYNSVVSFGSLGGNTSQDEGWGYWEVQKNNEGIFLLLRWHLKGNSVYQLQWGEPGIIFLDGEKYLVGQN
jgi:hypothetical protein